MINRTGLLIAAICALPLHRAIAQTAPVRVRHAPSCSGCSIRVTQVMSLGSPSDSVLPGSIVGLARDSRGRFYAGSDDRYSVVAYDAEGKLIAALGRKGQGPGENAGFGVLHLAVGKGDSLYVFQSGRVNVFSPTFKYVRTFVMSGSVTSVRPLRDGTFVLGAVIRTPDQIGYAYHVMDPDGTLTRSFGDASLSAIGMSRPARSQYLSPSFAVSPDQRSVWIAPFYHLREVRLDNAAGRSVDVFDAPWLSKGRDSVTAGRDGRRVTITVGRGSTSPSWMTPDGLLWIRAQRSPSHEGERPSYGLEVFDPVSQRVLVSQVVPHWLTFLSDEVAYSSSESADGAITYTVWRVTLVRSSSQ